MANPQFVNEVKQYLELRPPIGVRSIRTLNAIILGEKCVDPLATEALNIALVDDSITARDHLDDTFPTKSVGYRNTHFFRKVLLTALLFICLGILSGFLVFPPTVVIKDFGFYDVPTIDIQYTDSQNWSMKSSITSTITMINTSLMKVQIPLYSDHVLYACGLDSDEFTDSKWYMPAALFSRGRKRRRQQQQQQQELQQQWQQLHGRRLQDQRISIHNRDYNWGFHDTPRNKEEHLETDPTNRTTFSANVPVDSDAMDRPHHHLNTVHVARDNTTLSEDGFLGMFSLTTPDRLGRSPFPICYATPASSKPLTLTKYNTARIVVHCVVNLNATSPLGSYPSFFCPELQKTSYLQTSFWKSLGRSDIYRQDTLALNDDKGHLSSVVQVRIDDLVEACKSFGHLWIMFDLKNAWGWSFGRGGSKMLEQSTPPIAIPCSVT